jgi:hypothetical protein
MLGVCHCFGSEKGDNMIGDDFLGFIGEMCFLSIAQYFDMAMRETLTSIPRLS